MTRPNTRARLGFCLAESRSGVTSLLFAIMMVPLILILGIAIDFGFYIDAASKLDLAADAAAMHAVRAASMATSNGTTYQNAGFLAGEQWFAAQAEVVPGVTLNGAGTPVQVNACYTGSGVPVAVTVSVCYTAPTYSATVTYSGTLNTIFGRIVGVKTWPIAGTATSTISNSFVDFGIMIDNSQSMLIGATPADINTMNINTPCAVVTPTAQGTYPGLSMINYSYYLNGQAYMPQISQGPAAGPNYGYGYYTNANNQFVPETLPPVSPKGALANMFCDPKLIGGCGATPYFGYPPSVIYGGPAQPYLQKTTVGSLPAGACNNGGGSPGTKAAPAALGRYTPQAPCAFACHENANGGDMYAEARKLGVTLRLDVVQQAAQNLLTTMETYSKPPQTLLNVGIYTFNNSLQPVYPCQNLTGCASPFGADLQTAASDLTVCTGAATSGCLLPPVTTDLPNTNYPGVFTQAAAFLAGKQGDGLSQATAYKNLFIITDGISDWGANGQQTPQIVGPIDQLISKPCDLLKANGFTVYVLYTPYQPIPTWTYSYWPQSASPAGTYPGGYRLQDYAANPDPSTFPNYNSAYPTDTPVQAALRACATDPKNGFNTANDPADINTALQNMLATALNSAARVTN